MTWKAYQHPDGGTAFEAALPRGVPANFTALFVDGARAILARFPDGNPEDVSGMCVGRPTFANEGCSGWTKGGNATAFRQFAPSTDPKDPYGGNGLCDGSCSAKFAGAPLMERSRTANPTGFDLVLRRGVSQIIPLRQIRCSFVDNIASHRCG